MKPSQYTLQKILGVFDDLGKNLSLPLEHAAFFEHINRQVHRFLIPDAFLVYQYNDRSADFDILFQAMTDGIGTDQFHQDLKTICTSAFHARELVQIPVDNPLNNHHKGHLDEMPKIKGTAISTPLVANNRTFGTMSVYWQHPLRQFSDTDRGFLLALSSLVATSLYNADLLDAALNKATVSELVRSEMDEARLSAEAASVAKSQFLASMSHEIRTPMNGVINMAELLLDTQLTREQKRYVDIIQTSGEALLMIINDILDFSKIEAGQMILEKKTLSVRKCIEDAIDLLTPQANQKRLELLYYIDNTAPEMIEGDIIRIRQIIINLLNNSVKFTEKGEIFITLTGRLINEQDYPDLYELHFSVRDTGVGIPEDKQNQLFQAFNQLDASMTRKYGGTGLGLVICKQLSEMMGGRIWVESSGIPGEGSSFHFTITARAMDKEGGFDFRSTHPALEGKRVLIVTDQTSLNWILTAYCQDWGMHTWAAEAREPVLELLNSGCKFDLAILDRNIPETGSEMLAADIHNYPGNEKMPLVLLSSFTQSEEDVSPHLYAMTLPRPIKPGIFLDTLLKVMTGAKVDSGFLEPEKTRVNSSIGSAHPWRILLVEDNRVNQQVAQFILAKLGYDIDISNNGFEALQAIANKKARKERYDIILMDVFMPEMDGIETTQKIRQMLPEAEQPRIIALTADVIQHGEKGTTYPGMDGYLSKPINIDELTRILIQGNDSISLSSERSSIPLMTEVDESPIQMNVINSWISSVGNPIIFREIIDTYLEETPKGLEELALAVAGSEWTVIQKFSHTLKSTSATMGAMNLSSLFSELERIASHPENQEANFENIYQKIQDEYAVASRDLTAIRTGLTKQPYTLSTIQPKSQELPLIDMKGYQEYWSKKGGSPAEGYKQALTSFLNSVPNLIDHMEYSIGHGDHSELIKDTRQLMQVSESIGAIQLTELARILEHQRGKRGANEIKSTMDDIKTMFERIVQFSEQTKDNGKFE